MTGKRAKRIAGLDGKVVEAPKIGAPGGADRAAEAGRQAGQGGALSMLADWIAESRDRRRSPKAATKGAREAFRVLGYQQVLDDIVRSCGAIIRRDTLPREIYQLRGAQATLPIVRAITEAYGWDKARPPLVRPSPIELARLQMVLDWALRLGTTERALLMGRAAGASFGRLARLDPECRSKWVVRRAYYAVIDKIVGWIYAETQHIEKKALRLHQK